MALVAGCGGGSLPPETGPLSEGSEVSPQRYLADTVGAAEAVAAIWTAAQALGPNPGRADLRAASPRLASLQSEAVAAADRLRSARLRDQRLDRQRLDAVAALDPVLGAGADLAAAARAERPSAAVEARTRLAAAVATLRERLAGRPA